MNKKIISALKLLISFGLGVLIIFLVARNFSKPLKIKLETTAFSAEESLRLESWNASPMSYVRMGDTLALIGSSSGQTAPLLSIYEGTLVSMDVAAGDAVASGDILARVKVDIWNIVGGAFKRTNYWWILLTLCFGILSHISRALRWQMMFKPMGYDPKFSNSFGTILIMYVANLAFPRLGEVLRCSMLSRYEKIPINKSLGTMITERVLDLICLGIILLLTLILQYKIFTEFSNNYMPQQQGGYMKFIILGGGMLFLVAGFFLYRAGKLPFGNRIRDLAIGLWDGVRSIKDLERPWLFLFHTVFIWCMYFLMTAISLKALPETSVITLQAGFPMLFFGGIAMVAVQGGLGLYPYFISKILLLYGLTETVGYAFGWIMWTSQTAMVILAGLIGFIMLSVINKR